MALLSICQDCQGSILGPRVSPRAISSRMMPNIFPKSPKRCCLQVGPAHKSSALPKLLGPPSLDLHKNHKGTMRSHPLRGFLMETHGCLPQSMDSFWRCATPSFDVNKVLKGRLFDLPGQRGVVFRWWFSKASQNIVRCICHYLGNVQRVKGKF